MIPTPWPRSRLSVANSAPVSASDSEEVGSSRIRTRDRTPRARAISTICCCAVLRVATQRIGSPDLRQAEPGDQRLGLGEHPAAVEEAESDRLAPEQEVLRDREVRRQRELLVDHADPQPLGIGHVADLDAATVHFHRAGVGPDHAAQDVDQRRFPGTVLPEQPVDLPRAEREIHPVERGDAAEPLGQSRQGQQGPIAGAVVGHGLTGS